ncbi:hypothetical protein GEMRC1_003907 [Eukaryota sp. GEM-RC1]
MIVRTRTATGQYRVEVPTSGTLGDFAAAFKSVSGLSGDPQISITLPNRSTYDLKTHSNTKLNRLGITHGTIVHVIFSDSDNSFKTISSESDSTSTTRKCAHPPSMVCPNCLPPDSPTTSTTSNGKSDTIHLPEIPPRELTDNPQLRRQLCRAHGPNSACSRCTAIPGDRMKMKSQVASISPGISLSKPMISDILSYLNHFAFTRPFLASLYGITGKNNAIAAQASYTPPQSFDPEGDRPIPVVDDDFKRIVDEVAIFFEFKEVGLLIARSQTVESSLTMEEVLKCCSLQAQNETSALVLVTPQVSGGSADSSVEAFQVSKQALHLFTNDSLHIKNNDEGIPSLFSRVPVLIEGKETHFIPIEFCITPLAIHQHEGPLLHSFPAMNREGISPSSVALSQSLTGARTDEEFLNKCSDFNLVLWIATVLGDDTAQLLVVCIRQGSLGDHHGLRVLIESLMEQ